MWGDPKDPGSGGRDMLSGAQSALSNVLDMRDGDKVLVVSDNDKRKIGEAFFESAEKLGGTARMFMLDENPRPYSHVPDDLARILKGYDIAINAFKSNAVETPFRVELIHLETSRGTKVGHAPGITEDMMVGGPMNVDYRKIHAEAERLMAFFKDVAWVHITTDAGTDFRLCIKGREFECDTKILPGRIGNLPAGEVWCAPIETVGDGTVVVDGTVGDLGVLPAPVTIKMVKGHIASIKSESKPLEKEIRKLTSIDEMASVIGELGIGLNPRARLTGNMLEDEKAGGTAHIAFGDNIDMPGGTNNSCTHRDFLFYKPTIVVERPDGEMTLIDEGKLVI